MTPHSTSETFPEEGAPTPRLMYEAVRRADAMGLLDHRDVPRFDVAGVHRVVQSVRRAGIGEFPAALLHNVEQPSAEDVDALLRLVIAALEASPAPSTEWQALGRVFDVDQLSALLGVSASSLRRYQTGERVTPDDVAGRLHMLALVVGALAGAYNDIGIRRWFDRPRTQLRDRAPADILRGSWDPEGADARAVRDLAESLLALGAT
jgi:uncharacterized protein (DUF2384 family)